MGRSAKDATRFTATIPHAYSKPALNKNPRTPIGGLQGSNASTETPQEKVARLRAEHNARKAANFSLWDRVVVRGRLVADAAHRFTVMGLVGLTVIAGGVTVFSLGDMIMWNRRKKAMYYEEQSKLRQERITEAQAAVAAGIANGDQILLLNQERAKAEAEEEKKKSGGLFKKAYNVVFSMDSLNKEDTAAISPLEQKRVDSVSEETTNAATQLVEKVRDLPEKSAILQAVDQKRREGEKGLEKRGYQGGPLDQMAEEAVSAATQKSKSWTSWMTRS